MLFHRSINFFKCDINRLKSLRIVCDNQFNRMYSSHVTWRLANHSRQLFNCKSKYQLFNISWSSRASISSSVTLLSPSSSPSSPFSSESAANVDLGPLNLTQIADELSKLSNADKSGLAPSVAEDSVSITDIDLTEFTSPIDPNIISESLLTASDIGLTWFAPTNIIFKSLMAIHEQLPWWGSIAALTFCLRVLLSPLMIRNMKAAANMTTNIQSLEIHRTQFRKTMESDNQALQVKAAIEFLEAMKKNQFTVFKSMSPMLAMGIVFSSCFFAIRGMANYPIQSMKTEGLYWFTDLTVPDPYFILPALTSITLYYVIISGNETAAVDPLSARALKVMPMILCPIIVIVGASFPAALNTYWLTNNLISLGQGILLRKTKLREILNIPDPHQATQQMAKGSLQSSLEMQKDIQLASEIVKKVYKSKMTNDIKLQAKELKKDKIV